jgi:hypothetical protein
MTLLVGLFIGFIRKFETIDDGHIHHKCKYDFLTTSCWSSCKITPLSVSTVLSSHESGVFLDSSGIFFDLTASPPPLFFLQKLI